MMAGYPLVWVGRDVPGYVYSKLGWSRLCRLGGMVPLTGTLGLSFR